MSSRFIVVVDAGSTRIRCFVFDEKGSVVVRRSAPWSYLDSGTTSPYARELDAGGVWKSTELVHAARAGRLRQDRPGGDACGLAAVGVVGRAG